MAKFTGAGGCAFSSKSQEWETPRELYGAITREFALNVDVCASERNRKCRRYFSKKDDALSKEWVGRCWMNPPYGRAIGKWVKKAYESAQSGTAMVVCLLPARTDTAWWHDYCMKGEVRFLRGRVKFTRADGKTGPAPFPSAVVIFKVNTKGPKYDMQ